MGEKTTIKFGQKELTLTKSDDLMGVKLKVGAAPEAILAYRANQVSSTDALGGFKLINVVDAPGDGVEDKLERMRANGVVAVGTHVYHTSDDGVPFVPTGEIYVRFKDGVPADKIEELLSALELQIASSRDATRYIVRSTPQSVNPVKAAAALQESDLVDVAEPDLASPRVARNVSIPADELLARQWHLQNKGSYSGVITGYREGADARVISAWQAAHTMGDPTIVVAVIDDGFDLDHPDLSGPGKIVSPRDFSRNSTNPRPDLNAGDWHGTSCAGVAVGNANGTGIVGAAPRCRLMPVRWGPNLSDGQVEAWFDWVKRNGADVVSCSWGAAAKVFVLSERVSDAIADCAQNGRSGKGCVVCFAAGNENHNIADEGQTWDGFANHPDVIAVAASTSLDQRANYSNFGSAIAVCAPSSGAGGHGITTSDVQGQFEFEGSWYEAGYSAGPFTDDFGGTSSACPLVAGVCALLLSLSPELNAKEVKDLVQRTARRIGTDADYDVQGHSRKFGYGCIDAEQAVRTLLAPGVTAS